MKNSLYHDTNLDISMNPFSLHFSQKEYEDSFTKVLNTNSLLIIRFGIFLTAALFTVYGLVDLYTFPKTYEKLWLVRFFLDISLIALFFYTYVQSYVKYLQFVNFFVINAIGLTLIYLYSLPMESDFMYIFVASYVLYIAASFTLYGMKFCNAVVSNTLMFMGVSLIFYAQFDLISNVLYAILFISVFCIVVISSYFFEIQKRKLFLKEIYSDNLLLELQDTQIKLKKKADHDYLTALYNRRYLSTVSQELIKLSKRNDTPISIIVFDIDKFKNINDTYGHAAGDYVLKHIATLLTRYVRESDIVARIGGEEFAILLSNTGKKDAYNLAEKLRKIIENNIFFVNEETNLQVTVSAGVDMIHVASEKEMDFALNRADKSLYEAKNSGRNKVVM